MPLRRLLPALLTALLLAFTTISSAATLNLLWGGADGLHTTTAALETDPLWQRQLRSSRVDVDLESALGHSIAATSDAHHDLWHASLTPMFHWWFAADDAVEAGIGASVFSGIHIAGKDISTAYQFDDNLGLVHRFAGTPWSAGVRFTHYSNAGIKHPNPGQNYLLLHIGYAIH